MTTPTSDTFGFDRLLPGPGWVVIDAARDRRFTGELVLTADEPVSVYFDRGRIYLAERASDPPLGTRLVQTGAVTQAQLDHGRLQILDIEHLGRMFDRVPTISRDSVLAVTDLMNEQTVSWLAARQVWSVVVAPYRHHESGLHTWNTRTGPATHLPAPLPPMTLPSPTRPNTVDRPPVPAFPPPQTAPADDEGHDDRSARPEAAPHETPIDEPDEAGGSDDEIDESVARGDGLRDTGENATDDETPRRDTVWDRPGADAIPTIGAVADLPVPPLDRTPVHPADRFEVIWPTGETDDLVEPTEFAGEVGGHAGDVTPISGEYDLRHVDATEPRSSDDDDDTSDDTSDDTMAVRRAVATIDTGSLAARRRLVEATTPGPAGDPADEAPASENGTPTATTGAAPADDTPPTASDTGHESDAHRGRAGALRRMIGSLKRD